MAHKVRKWLDLSGSSRQMRRPRSARFRGRSGDHGRVR